MILEPFGDYYRGSESLVIIALLDTSEAGDIAHNRRSVLDERAYRELAGRTYQTG